MEIRKCFAMKNIGNVDVVAPKEFAELIKIYREFIKGRKKFVVIGGGSNTLISDAYKGTVVLLTSLPYTYEVKKDDIYVSAFYPTNKFALELAMRGYDYSFLAGIPGLLGGAIYNNAGSYGSNIGDVLQSVEYLNSNGEMITLTKEQLLLEYRYSIFRDIEGIIIGCTLKKRESGLARHNVLKNLSARKNKLPHNASIGSIFKNSKLIHAWRVIDELGLRGYQIGGAAFSNKHANVIINVENASFKDIKSLILLAKKRALEELGIVLEEEITIIE